MSTQQTSADDEPEKIDRENWQAAYTEFGQWARHYSTIRATLTATLVTISVALLYYGVDKQIKPLWVLSIVVCVLAITLLLAFTRATWKRMEDQFEAARILGILGSEKKLRPWYRDEGLWAGAAFLAVYLGCWFWLYNSPPVSKPQEVIVKGVEQPIPVRTEPSGTAPLKQLTPGPREPPPVPKQP